jgi:hypothetical protein
MASSCPRGSAIFHDKKSDPESEMKRWIAVLLATLGAVTCATAAEAKDHPKHKAQAVPAAMFPPTECEAYVAYDRDMKLPGYILPTKAGPRTCIPFTSVAAHKPKAYRGDFYVTNFTDEKLRKRWKKCKHDKKCHKRVYEQVLKRHPPNKEYALICHANRASTAAKIR